MTIMSTYSDIATALEKWLNREGLAQVSDNAEEFITMAQRRIQRKVRIPAMELVSALTVDAQTVQVPSDLLEVIDIVLEGSGVNVHLERQPWDFVALHTQTGQPDIFARAGANFWFGPIPDQSYTANIFYYAELPFVSATNPTNWFSQYAPELILTAAQVEALVYLKDDQRMPVIDQKYQAEEARVIDQAAKDQWSSNSRSTDETIRLYGAL